MKHSWIKWRKGCKLPKLEKEYAIYSVGVLVAYKYSPTEIKHNDTGITYYSTGQYLAAVKEWELDVVEASIACSYKDIIILGWKYIEEFN